MKKEKKKIYLDETYDDISDKISKIKEGNNKNNNKSNNKNKNKKNKNRNNNNFNSSNKNDKEFIKKEKKIDYSDDLDDLDDFYDDELSKDDVDIDDIKVVPEKEEKIDKKKKLFGKNKKEKKVKDKPKKKRSIFKKIITIILIIGIIGVLSVAVFLAFIVITAPEFDENALTVKDQTVLYDIDGNVMATLGTEKRESVSYDELPQVLIDAIIATEDSRFFQHNGVDLFRFVKATLLQLTGKDEAGGASTLTMQTVKNNLTKKDTVESNIVKKIIRKFQDVYLAVFKVEKEYSKEQILEFYVNDNYLGGSYYGVEEASKYYFGKSVSDLTLPEAAVIAGLFQLPGKNNPYKNIEGATKRRTLVLKYMYNHKYITKEEKELAEKVPIESLLVGDNASENPYQGYIDTVVEEVIDKTGDNPYTVPMKVYTTMEKSIQDGVNAALNNNDAWYWKKEDTTAGVAVVNVETGAIAAVGAGRNKTGERVFNNATQAKRQPGSTAKPIFDYGPGIEFSNFSTYTLFVDEPWTYTNGPSVNNWDGGFIGLNTARTHLMQSRNIPALKAFQRIGPKNSQKFAYSLGLDVALNDSSENYRVINESTGLDNTINEAYAIGGVAEGFTPLEMAVAYSGFASGGYFTESHSVNKIEYRDTDEVKEFKYTKERVMKDSTAYIINSILESAVSGGGFAGGAAVKGSHVAAKTGTTNFDEATMKAKGLPDYAVNDLWTIAYTSQYSIAVWYGYDKVTSTSFNVNGGGFKEGLVGAVMQHIPKDTKGWTRPSSVVEVAVERETWPAALPSEYTPSNLISSELFVRGTQPTEVSNRFAKLPDVKNVTTSKGTNAVTISWDFDTPQVLTTSYIQSYFNKDVFGNSRGALANRRIDYNNTTLGGVVFAVYKEDSSGELSLVGTTKNNSYTYQGYGDTNLVIKTEYGNFKSNASSGVKIKVSLEEQKFEQIVATLNGSNVTHVSAGTYTERGFKSIYYGTLDITNTADITYQVTGNSSILTSSGDVEGYINTLPAGTYTITYNIEYLGQKVTKTRSVTIS